MQLSDAQLSDAASAIALEDERGYFVHHGRMGERVPRDVTRVRIDSSVSAIKEGAFRGRWQLTVVILNDRLEEIGCWGIRGFQMARRDHHPQLRQDD